MANILIVEDDIDIAQGVAEFLESKGHELDFAYTGKQALSLLEINQYQLVLLDINLPYVNGYDICRSLSNTDLEHHLAKLPVIMMSARGQEHEVLEGFQSGAWDYLIKPFSFSELAARVNVALMKSATQHSSKQVLQYKNVILDSSTLTLSQQESTLQLHQVGFELINLLIAQAPNVVKTQTIHQALWPNETPDSDPLRAHIYKLRKQLTGAFGQAFIETVKGVGYRFNVNPEVESKVNVLEGDE